MPATTAPTQLTTPDTPIHAVVAEDFAAVNRTIQTQLASRIPLVEAIGQYIVDSGGKRMRLCWCYWPRAPWATRQPARDAGHPDRVHAHLDAAA